MSAAETEAGLTARNDVPVVPASGGGGSASSRRGLPIGALPRWAKVPRRNRARSPHRNHNLTIKVNDQVLPVRFDERADTRIADIQRWIARYGDIPVDQQRIDFLASVTAQERCGPGVVGSQF